MKRLLTIVILLQGLCLFAQTEQPQLHSVKKVVKLMGSRFEFTAVHSDAIFAETAIFEAINEVQRIEKLISSWDPASQTSEINRQAGEKPVVVDKELYDLIYRSLKVARLTGGAFDISFAAAERIWKFDGSMEALPDSQSVAGSVRLTGYEKIEMNSENSSVFLKEKGMRIGFGAIGKGYAANKAKALMQEMGIPGGVVNAGGDLVAWGKKANSRDWKVGIADPRKVEKVLAWIWVNDIAIVTSGDYEKYAMIEGRRFAHIIDPRTGWPVEGVRSVTVICPDAELADALATGIFVLGVEKGLELVNQLKSIECLIVDDKNELHASKNLPLNYYKDEEVEKGLYMKIGGKDEK